MWIKLVERKEPLKAFCNFFEDSIIEEDVGQSISHYQQAITDAKLKLDFAIAPRLWLIPSNLIINTESKIGYNNNLKTVTPTMKFGINNLVNFESKLVGINKNKNSKTNHPHQQNKESPAIFNSKNEDKKMEDNESPIQ